MTMYYIIEQKYVGPNADRHPDVDTIWISTVPGIANGTGKPQITGWLGTTNDWSRYAHGEYPTLQAARDVLETLFGEIRDCDPNGDPWESDDDTVVDLYKPGAYALMGYQEAADWINPGLYQSIHTDTTDEEIRALIWDWEVEANLQGYTLPPCVEGMVTDFRDYKREATCGA
jgi:hypothetical protein